MYLWLCNLIEVVLPSHRSARLVREATTADLIDLLHPHTSHNITILLPYKHPLVRACITEAKFRHNLKAQHLLAAVFTKYQKTTSINSIYIPIPLSSKRQRERGHNQVTSVLMHTPINDAVRPWLIRTRHTTPQTKLRRADRIKNMHDVFSVPEQYIPTLTNQHIVVCDDVLTTGTTINYALAELAAHQPASLRAIAFAH